MRHPYQPGEKWRRKIKKLNRWGYLLSCVLAVLPVSCRPVVNLPVADNAVRSYYVNGGTYRDIALTFWDGISINYVFWDIEPDRLWDTMWDDYLPGIEALGTRDPEDTAKNSRFMGYLREMIAPLHDGHFTLSSGNYQFAPQRDRVRARFSGGITDDANPELTFSSLVNDWTGDSIGFPGYKKWNFVKDLINPRYLSGEGRIASNHGLRIAQGKVGIPETGGHITYLYFSGFMLNEVIKKESTAAPNNRLVTNLLNTFWQNLRSRECKGLIFDMRGNIGGATADIEYLLRPLLTEDIYFANLRTKKGEGRLNYTPWVPYTFSPRDPIPNAGSIPVVALINDYSISCGELLPLAVRALPKGYLIGTTTWGATGPRIGNDYPNALNDGSFTVRWNTGSLNVVQAGYQTRGKNFENYEGIGVEPDLRVPFSWKEFTNNGACDAGGIDAQLEAAINHIRADTVHPN